jgi:D-psicose/D-tagatose/L-ribulose 3-epimerase
VAIHRRSNRPLSISNIAWPAEADAEALILLARLGFDGIELAPSKVFGDISAISLQTVRAYRRQVEDQGLAICALQAILFGVQGAHLFESTLSRQRMADHLRRIAEVAATLGARACVFGSPALRDPGNLVPEKALAIAEAFFRAIAGDYAAQEVELCFEANPSFYQCRFVTHTREAMDLVKRVNAPGFGLQLDTGTIFINGEDPGVIREVESQIRHFHISEPALVPVGTAGVDHLAVAIALCGSIYTDWISIEMRAVEDWRGAVLQAHHLVDSIYREKVGPYD